MKKFKTDTMRFLSRKIVFFIFCYFFCHKTICLENWNEIGTIRKKLAKKTYEENPPMIRMEFMVTSGIFFTIESCSFFII